MLAIAGKINDAEYQTNLVGMVTYSTGVKILKTVAYVAHARSIA